MTSDYGKVAVIYGGNSAEREVSIRSGKAVLDGLLSQGINAYGVDAADQLITQLQQGSYDRAFIVLHGPEGEDGAVQGALQWLGIPYTGSNVMGSAIAMDKIRCLQVWQATNLPVPRFAPVHSADPEPFKHWQLPLAVKPVYEGSSIGLTKVKSWDQFALAYTQASQYGPVMVEEWVSGREYCVGIVGETVLPSIWIEPQREFYDYVAKYGENSGTRYHCPSMLTQDKEQEIQQLCKQAFDASGCSGWGRVDVIADESGSFHLMEINPAPGMTTNSLVPKAAAQVGWSFEQLCNKILAQTLPGKSMHTGMPSLAAGS